MLGANASLRVSQGPQKVVMKILTEEKLLFYLENTQFPKVSSK
jgi:hypothetical protein